MNTMKNILKHLLKFIIWLLDIIFGIFVVLSLILIVSVIFFPNDNIALELGKWLATHHY